MVADKTSNFFDNNALYKDKRWTSEERQIIPAKIPRLLGDKYCTELRCILQDFCNKSHIAKVWFPCYDWFDFSTWVVHENVFSSFHQELKMPDCMQKHLQCFLYRTPCIFSQLLFRELSCIALWQQGWNPRRNSWTQQSFCLPLSYRKPL